jgi:glycosyltransferase involved in cell wall biosynthesis
MKLTIGIKALNEAENIAACVRSALEVARKFGGEVIVADSGSTDRTVPIARSLGARVVQLADPAERSCGVGAQLAFQAAHGDYFYLIDGDMVLHPEFAGGAIAFLEEHASVAGVSGIIVEQNHTSEEFQIRSATARSSTGDAENVDRLDGGGIYRSSAVRKCGYLADRNLHSFEEFELGARLRAKGWSLVRLNRASADHFGHRMSGYRLLWRRIRSGYAQGVGEVLRASLGRPHFGLVLTGLRQIRQSAVVIGWWLALAAALGAGALLGFALLLAAPVVMLTLRRGSLALGLYSCAAWNVNAYGLITGLMRSRAIPEEPIRAVEITDG